MIRPWSKTRSNSAFQKLHHIVLIPVKSCISPINYVISKLFFRDFFQSFKNPFPPVVPYVCRKEPSARVLILATVVPGGQACRTENHLFMALSLETERNFSGTQLCKHTEVESKVVKWACFVPGFLFSETLQQPSFTSAPRSLAPKSPLTPLHSHLCSQLTCNQNFSLVSWCLDHAYLAQTFPPLNR